MNEGHVKGVILKQRADLDLCDWSEEIVGECKALVRLWKGLFVDGPPEELALPHRWKPEGKEG